MNALAQEKRNALNKAVYFLRAKARCKGQAFSCFLDEQPTALVPGLAREGLNTPADEANLVVNSSFRYQQGAEPPPEVVQRGLPLDSFVGGYPIAWVEDPGTRIWMPFWARGEWAEALESLRPGESAPAGLRSAVRQTLTLATILVPPAHEQERGEHWQRICRAGR